MSKILITSLGSGRYDKETKEARYTKAKYYVDGNRGNVEETEYIYTP